jgi:hypothetical protein
MTTLAAVMVKGTFSAMPTAGVNGRTFYSSDTGQIFYDNGEAWVNVTPAPTAAAISAIQQHSYTYTVDTGVANAYVVALIPTPTVVAGSEVIFKAVSANTGPSTLAVNGSVPVAINKQGTVALAGGEIAAGQIIRAIFDGVNFQI